MNWIGKESIVNHDKKVPFRLLKKNNSKSVNDSKNLIIEGDNLEALKALLPYYQNKIKCIFIDPPYNTGNENWIYNDNVNSPKIKQWLGKVVGGEGEDLTRHDKWLCMMYPRLKLLKSLLMDEGSIFVSIDDNEYSNLKLIMDEIFEPGNYLGTIIWEKNYSPRNDAKTFSSSHDYILAYGKNRKHWEKKSRNLLPRTELQDQRYKNPDNDPRGRWMSDNLSVKTYNAQMDYTITTPGGKKIDPPPGSCWRLSMDQFEKWKKDNRIWFGVSKNNTPRIKRFLNEVQSGIVPVTLWTRDVVGDTQEAKREVLELLKGGNLFFETPKPTRLISRIIELVTNNDDIILDSFAGTGTTGHSTLLVNHRKNSNRKFILIELESEICKNITSTRIKNVIKNNQKNENDSQKLKDGFQYCVLDKPLFDEEGKIDESCSFEDLASYVYFTETKTILNKKSIKKHLIGDYNETNYYLIFDKIGKNVLDKEFLKSTSRNQSKIVYADKCTISEEILEQHKTIFKQIPYEVRVF